MPGHKSNGKSTARQTRAQDPPEQEEPPRGYAPEVTCRNWAYSDLVDLDADMTVYGIAYPIGQSAGIRFWNGWAEFWKGVARRKQTEAQILQIKLILREREALRRSSELSIAPVRTVASITPTVSPKLSTSSSPAVSTEPAKQTSSLELALSLTPPGSLDATTAETKHDDEISLTCRKCNEDFPSQSALLDHAYSNCGSPAQRARRLAEKVAQNVTHTTKRLQDRARRFFYLVVEFCRGLAWDLAVGAAGAAVLVLGLGGIAMLVVLGVLVSLGMLVWWAVVWLLVLLWMLANGAFGRGDDHLTRGAGLYRPARRFTGADEAAAATPSGALLWREVNRESRRREKVFEFGEGSSTSALAGWEESEC